MATYTGESLDKLRKQDLVPIVLCLPSILEDKDNTVLEKVRKLNDAISKVHAELAITKNANNLLLTLLWRDSARQIPNIQDKNVLILCAFLGKCLEKF